MNLPAKIHDILLYGGLSQEQFLEVWPGIMRENLRNVRLYTIVGTSLFAVLSLASHFANHFVSSNQVIYLCTALAMGILFVVAHIFIRTENRFPMLLVRLFAAVLYVFSIAIGLCHASFPMVSALVVLAIIPLLVTDRPIYIAFLTIVAGAAACSASASIKPPLVSSVDIWNVVSFGAMALVANILVSLTKFKAVNQTREISYLSTTDVLTGLQNRNSYELMLDGRAGMNNEGIICVYFDANGLHDLNNRFGHEAGDEMLCTLAGELRKLFGERNSYRTGGDEFVAFRFEGSLEQMQADIDAMTARVGEKGYNVSHGFCQANADEEDVRSLVRRAEAVMYENKAAYYRVHDRRRPEHN